MRTLDGSTLVYAFEKARKIHSNVSNALSVYEILPTCRPHKPPLSFQSLAEKFYKSCASTLFPHSLIQTT